MTERRVAIHRNLLFVPNEAFIVSQAQHLRRYQALLSALAMHPGGQPSPGIQRAVLTELTGRWRATFWNAALMAGRVAPRPLLRRISSFQPHVFHVHFGADAFLCLPLARKVRAPLIVTFHGYDVNEKASSSLAAAAYTHVRSKVFDRAARVIAVSDFLRQRLIDVGCPTEKVVRHYIGVDPLFFSRRAAPDARPTIAFVGRLVGFKGCQILLEAAGRLPRRKELKLLVVGSGPEEQRLRNLASALEVDAEFLGSGSPAVVRAALERSSIFCLPTFVSPAGHEESLSIVALEAQSMGVPVVSTTVGGVPEAILDGQTGILVPPRDIDATAAALERLLGDDDLRSRMAAAARQHVQSKFDIEPQTEELERIYDSVALP